MSGWIFAAYLVAGLALMLLVAPEERDNVKETAATVVAGAFIGVPVACYVVLRYLPPYLWRRFGRDAGAKSPTSVSEIAAKHSPLATASQHDERSGGGATP